MAYNKVNSSLEEAVFVGVKRLLSRRTTPWVGRMTDLQEALVKVLQDNRPEQWVTSPVVMRLTLNKVINRLRNAGVSVKFTRSTDKTRTRLVRFSA